MMDDMEIQQNVNERFIKSMFLGSAWLFFGNVVSLFYPGCLIPVVEMHHFVKHCFENRVDFSFVNLVFLFTNDM